MDANTSANCTMPFVSKEFTGVALLRAATGSISFLCALCSILLIVAYKRYLLSFQRVALYFCIASAIKGLADATNRVDYMVTNSDTYNYCVWAGFFTQYALWTLFLSIVCFVTCSMGKVVFQKEHVRLERCLPVLIFAFPLAFNWIPFIYSTYGRSGLVCWIRDINPDCTGHTFGIWMQYVLWTVPQAILLTASTVAYFVGAAGIVYHRRKWMGVSTHETEEENRDKRKEVLILLLFPVIFVLCNIPNFAVSVLQTLSAASSSDPLLPIWYLYALLTPLAPGFICFIYTTNFECASCRNIVTTLRRTCAGICVKRKIYEYPVKPVENEFEDTDHHGAYAPLIRGEF